ncbi:MAG TPA: hypothetical protein VGE51_10855 [Fontimonas sp.]
MRRTRTLLSVLLGLMLLVQGVAVSAAPYENFADAASTQLAAPQDPPCHGGMSGESAPQHPSCCDASCPDMTSCALGHLATAIDRFALALPPATPTVQRPTPVQAASGPLATPLRPPISLHG